MSKTTHFGFETVDEKDRLNASRRVHLGRQQYDIMNDLMSAGLHRI